MPDDENDLATIVLRERRDNETLILPAPNRRYEAFLLEPMQRAPHRRSAQPQPLCHRALGDTRARREMSPDDEAAQFLIDAGDGVGPHVAIDRSGSRPAAEAGRICARGAAGPRSTRRPSLSVTPARSATDRCAPSRPVPIRSTDPASDGPFWSTIVVCPTATVRCRSRACPPTRLPGPCRSISTTAPAPPTTRRHRRGLRRDEPSGLTYRAFASLEDATACVALQGEIWGTAFDHVPASILRIATNIGGLTIGAFDANGALVGFVFSLTGARDGEPIHWSHMLGVREDVRGTGVGRHLKELQRAELARRGVTRVLWTFDPLQARNAHLNFNRLGVRLIDYVENMYGITASPLHHGLATDRLVVMLSTSPDAGPARRRNGMNGSARPCSRHSRAQATSWSTSTTPTSGGAH